MNDVLTKLRRDDLTTINISSHNLEYVSEISSKIVLIDSGIIMYSMEKNIEAIEKSNIILKFQEISNSSGVLI